jgi:L-fuconate dehydratase
VGWLGYQADDLVKRADESRAAGYRAMKLKIGSARLEDDVDRVGAVRAHVGDDMLLMVDANQRWGVDGAIAAGRALAPFDPFWFEEPVHPDDLRGYGAVRDALTPMRIAGGEHLSNQVLFKGFIAAGAIDVVQADVVRLGGLPEYLAVALMAAKADLPVLPHVGDMGQIHQHLIMFTRCALGMPELPLEMIPHVADRFAEPCTLRAGRYVLPEAPGSSTSFTDAARGGA